MPRTDPQRLASRLNGAFSRGPITPQGRLASSRNATKHGLTGSGKSLPPDMEQELTHEIAIFVTQFHPQSPYEHDLIRRAALGNLRSRRITDTLNALTDDRSRNATRLWDESRRDEITALAARLPQDPADALRLLLRSAEGCDYLGDAWEALAHSLQSRGSWTDSQSLQALHLLGLSAPPDLASDDPLTHFWLCVRALRPETRTAPKSPDPSDALADLLNFIQDQVADLEAEGSMLWEAYDLPSRQSASARAAFDASPESARLDRYLRAAERLRRQSLDELHRLRRESAKSPAPNEPTTQTVAENPISGPIASAATNHPTPTKADQPATEPRPVSSSRENSHPPQISNKPTPPALSPELSRLARRNSILDGLALPPLSVTSVPVNIGRSS